MVSWKIDDFWCVGSVMVVVVGWVVGGRRVVVLVVALLWLFPVHVVVVVVEVCGEVALHDGVGQMDCPGSEALGEGGVGVAGGVASFAPVVVAEL